MAQQKKVLSQALQRRAERLAEGRVKNFLASVNQKLAPVAEPGGIFLTDGISGLGGFSTDLVSRYLTQYLATDKNGNPEQSWIGQNPQYASGLGSMGFGTVAYAANLLLPGSKLKPLRQGVRTGSTVLGYLGLNRILTQWRKIPY